MWNQYFLIITIMLSNIICSGQHEGDFQFGVISVKERQLNHWSKDSSANAIVLNEYGSGALEYDEKFEVKYYHHVRIKILNRQGFNEGNCVIQIYKPSWQTELLPDLKAYTYHIEGDQVKQYKVEKSAIFSEKTSDDFYNIKFTFPNIKEGSIY